MSCVLRGVCRMGRRPIVALLAAAAGILAALALPLGDGALAAASDWVDSGQTRVRLLSAGPAPDAEGRMRLGLEFDLEPGWKIYWRSPGDAGVPPEPDWSGSSNLRFAELEWPAPHRFTLFGLQTFGYGDHVVLPVSALAKQAGEPVQLRTGLSYLACSEICVPHQVELALDLPADGDGSEAAALIDRFGDWVPAEGAGHGLQLRSVATRAGAEGPLLEVEVASLLPFEAPDLLVEGNPDWLFDVPTVDLSDDRRSAMLRAPAFKAVDDAAPLQGSWLTLTVVDWTDGRPRALERSLEVTAQPQQFGRDNGDVLPAPRPVSAEPTGLAVILGLALLGGLILNLMPCVLPVLSLKLLSVVGHGGGEAGAVRRGFLASAAGILFSFLVLAGALIALKAGGVAVGWGIQFQQPLFLVALVAVLFLFAANLWGLFEIGLPGFLADWLSGGQAAGRAGGLAGHFLTGAFATLLATPCSAPFLGTAVGFALSRGPAEILLVFCTLGLGLALPYLLVALAPQLATHLPKPGAWMITLKRVLSLALAGTAVWLLTVLGTQAGWSAAVGVGLLLALAVLAIAVRGRIGRRPALAACVAVGLAAFAVPVFLGTADRGVIERDRGGVQWTRFDPDRLDRLIADGRTVFVDVTADWCLTCKVNKRLVLDGGPVTMRLAGPVVAMQADWTSPDPAITAFLNRFGRYGIPFNVAFGPGAPEGVPLPELLTEQAVLDAIDRAEATGPQTATPAVATTGD